jgi:cytochrome b
MNGFPTWDFPTRAFHWLLTLAVVLSWASHEFEWEIVHLWSGYTVITLVLFRLGWGFVGSVHSRFTDFVRGPSAVWQDLRGADGHSTGHTPAAGWSILLLLGLLLAQAVSGLFNSDELLFDGPLHHLLNSSWSDRIGDLHEKIFWALSSVICLHIAAVIYYQFKKQRNLIGPMLHGGSEGRQATVSNWRAIALLAACIAGLYTAWSFIPAPVLPW